MNILPEVEVWYALPAIRRKLALALRNKGLKQKEVANLMGVAESAVSQYYNNKRGLSELPGFLEEEFSKSVEKIIQGDNKIFIKEVMRLANLLRETKVICEIHHQHEQIPEKCSICFEK